MLDKMKHDSVFICSLCGKTSTGWGHNPEPLKKNEERCCEQCNVMKVIPARLSNVFMLQSKRNDDAAEAPPPDDFFNDDNAIIIKTNNDPYYNLLGALHDLEHGVNDQVVRDTISRVLTQIKPKRLQP